ncbi:MAG: phosphoribosyltransferase [Kofleriaceae bacterium]|nr:phosphoribosyltransferase [Kofleriaceae bacterium]
MNESEQNDGVPVTIEDDPTARRELFPDRRTAGKRLAHALAQHLSANTLVIGLARGGIVVADEIARTLELPLDVWLVRKIGVPFRPEIAMGALAEGASLIVDRDIVAWTSTTNMQLRNLVHHAAQQIRERARRYRAGRPRPDVRNRDVFLVDDGIVTGGTLRAAIRSLRKCGAKRVVVAAPVAGPAALQVLAYEADEIVCLARPLHLVSVGAWYADFHQVPDREVAYLLASAAVGRPAR